MIAAPLPSDEEARLAAIEHYRLGGIGREEIFDHITELAVCAFKVPISLVAIIGSERQCFRGAHGLAVPSTPRSVSFCSHAVAAGEMLIVEDALRDERFRDNPLVTGEPRIRFYAGAPLRLKDQTIPGTLCLIDRKPRTITADEREELARLARLVVDVIELRLGSMIAEERHQALARMKDEFVSATSHELRTPLTSIAGSLALLEANAAGELPDRTKRLVGIAHANATRLVALVNDILDFDKLAAGEVTLDLKPLNVAAVLRECAEANAGFAAEHGVSIVVEPVPERLSVVADRDRLMQVLTNLVSNAVKFSDSGQLVTLGARQMADAIRLSVMDRGPGIPEDFRDRVFTRFAQGPSAHGRGKRGTGLGLAIVKELVERMGGRVGFETERGRGTTFQVDLQPS